MSLITRCPACGTMFKVVPDQLRISEGWVRCGQCAEIFDANANLQGAETIEATVPAPLQVPWAAAGPDEAPMPTEAGSPAPTPVDPPVEKAQPAAAPIAIPIRREAPDSIDAPPLYPSFPSEVLDSSISRDSREEVDSDLDSVSFVRHARREDFWRLPRVRALLVLTAVLLAILLGVQYLVQERDRLAVTRPGLRPLVQFVCGRLRCDVGPARQIEAIAIDSSAFSRLRPDIFRLSFSLRSQAPVPVAMPSIELTFTDSQDQPVIRRVLSPPEFGAAMAIPAAGESTASIVMAVSASAVNTRIAGYRLLAFYP
jgi:predicted Zn finger-like uncharacterized protein